MPLQPGSRHGVYEILAAIGAGGMGEVYRARDTTLKRDVALKVLPDAFALDQERMARFQREAEVLASLNHPNIAAIYGLEESDGVRALVLELVEGPTLQERLEARGSGLEKTGALPLDEAIAVARQITLALEAAHERGIIHRDLKPANIKVRPDGSVKVLDFGLAKAFEPLAPVDLSMSPTITSPAATRMGVILGTAAYMSPEQARGQAVDKRADIWAFGVVLYEMLTGQRLFDGDTVSDTLASVLKETPEWDRVPAQALPLLRRCLEKDPRRRLRDIGDAMTLLEDAPATAATAAPPARRASWAWPTVAALLAVALAGLALVQFRQTPPAAPETTRFQIASPETRAAVGPFAVSPDGRQLVFAAAGSDNVIRLWVRPLDSLAARPLAGTEMSAEPPPPFWSPDSRFVAFDAGGKLKKIDISGGPAQTLCDAPAPVVGGSWSSDGVILFALNLANIMRVSATGGVATPVTRLDSSRREVTHLFPSFLPDGRHFLYLRFSDTLETSGVYVGSLDAKPDEQSIKQLVATTYGPVPYVPAPDSAPAPRLGQLLFRREGTLMAQPFDDRKLELSGEPVPVTEQVGSFLAFGFFSASTNGVLVYRSGGARQRNRITWFDRHGTVRASAAEPGNYISLALSPDGGRAAAIQLDVQAVVQDLWVLDFAPGTSTRLTFGRNFVISPVWSPDGSRVIFAANPEGPYQLFEKPANGAKEEEVVLKSALNKTPTSWSRDGRYLLYTELNPQTKNDVWVLSLDGRKPTPFLQSAFNEDQGQFSPDGRFVAYISDQSGHSEVYVRDFSAGGMWLVSIGGGSGPRWRGDGKELFYSAPDGTIMSVDIVITGAAFQARSPKAAFKMPPAVNSWDVTADGTRFLGAVPVEQNAIAPLTVVLNWQEGLNKK